MANYRLLIKPSAVKELEGAPRKDRVRLAKRLQALASDPRVQGAEKLTGQELFRIRQGNYRVVYEVSDQGRTVTVFKIGHRREVYR